MRSSAAASGDRERPVEEYPRGMRREDLERAPLEPPEGIVVDDRAGASAHEHVAQGLTLIERKHAEAAMRQGQRGDQSVGVLLSSGHAVFLSG